MKQPGYGRGEGMGQERRGVACRGGGGADSVIYWPSNSGVVVPRW